MLDILIPEINIGYLGPEWLKQSWVGFASVGYIFAVVHLPILFHTIKNRLDMELRVWKVMVRANYYDNEKFFVVAKEEGGAIYQATKLIKKKHKEDNHPNKLIIKGFLLAPYIKRPTSDNHILN